MQNFSMVILNIHQMFTYVNHIFSREGSSVFNTNGVVKVTSHISGYFLRFDLTSKDVWCFCYLNLFMCGYCTQILIRREYEN